MTSRTGVLKRTDDMLLGAKPGSATIIISTSREGGDMRSFLHVKLSVGH